VLFYEIRICCQENPTRNVAKTLQASLSDADTGRPEQHFASFGDRTGQAGSSAHRRALSARAARRTAPQSPSNHFYLREFFHWIPFRCSPGATGKSRYLRWNTPNRRSTQLRKAVSPSRRAAAFTSFVLRFDSRTRYAGPRRAAEMPGLPIIGRPDPIWNISHCRTHVFAAGSCEQEPARLGGEVNQDRSRLETEIGFPVRPVGGPRSSSVLGLILRNSRFELLAGADVTGRPCTRARFPRA